MNASVGQINEYRRRFGVTDLCAVPCCGRLAVYGRYCEDCYQGTQANVRYAQARAEQRADPGYGRFALAVIQRFEWIGTLAFVAFGLAVLAFESRHFFFECVMGLKDVLGWGK